MQRSKAKQSGFSIVEGVLIVVALVALVGGGWLVYQRVKQSATTTDAASTPAQQAPSAPASPTVTYLTIKEWGVKVPLTDSIKDAYYVPSTSNVDENGLPATVWVGMKSLDTAGCNISAGEASTQHLMPLGAILRVAPTATDNVTGATFASEYPGVTIGSYYYAFKDLTKFRSCASAAALQSIGSQFNTAIKSTSTTN